MIFSFQSSARNQEIVKDPNSVDHDRLIDISLVKLSSLHGMGKRRTEKHILFVLEVLQRALYSKSIDTNGESKEFYAKIAYSNHLIYLLVSVADLVFFFEQEIYSAMMRSNVNRLPRLWIDLPGGMEKAKEIQSKSLPFRIKASFGKKS